MTSFKIKMVKQEFTYEYKEKLDFLMQQSESTKIKEIILKLYDLPQETGELLLKSIQEGVWSK